MRVVVTGATGNVGSSVVRALAADERVDQVVGLSRRLPRNNHTDSVVSVAADVTRDDLGPVFEGADAVVHLAWAIQPARDRSLTRTTNVEGSRRVFGAAREAGVGTIVYASSIGAYSPGEQDEDARVDESWPTDGIPSSFYSVDKAEVESILDAFEREADDTRVVRLRPALIFKHAAGSEIRRLFAGPLIPNPLLEPSRLPVMPWVKGLTAQAVHTDDVADAYRRAVLDENARGAFNIAAEPVLDKRSLAEALGVRVVELPAALLRPIVTASWRTHLQPTPPGWLDMAVGVPLMDTTRARDELGWEPRHDSTAALRELLAGISESAGEDLPPLAPDNFGARRWAELLRGGPAR
jgi:UDP-glucose 4-epimerase